MEISRYSAENTPWSSPHYPDFRVAYRNQDPHEAWSSEAIDDDARSQFATFIENRPKPNATEPEQPSNPPWRSPYFRLSKPYEIRVLEVLPAKFSEPIHGQLHHVSVEFEYADFSDPPTPTVRKSTRHAVSLEEGRPICYTALSYVWGADVVKRAVICGDSQISITKSLDTAIRHLRQDSHSVMLWIDQLCINQADQREKESQVSLMGLIYRRAWNTVIWLGQGPGGGAFEALRDVDEAFRFQLQDVTEQERDTVLHRSNVDLKALSPLQVLFDLPWFKRTWTVQEAVLSEHPYVMLGSETDHWENFAGYCVGIKNLSLFDDKPGSEDVASTTSPSASRKISGSQVAAQLWSIKSYHDSHTMKSEMLSILEQTRYAEVGNPLDKIYGILGLCEHDIDLVPDYSEPHPSLFKRVTVQLIRKQLKIMNRYTVSDRLGQPKPYYGYPIFQLLSCIDHEPWVGADIPSWVADWSRPRVTKSLAFATSALGIYNSGGSPAFDVIPLSEDERHLCLRSKVCDIIVSLSSVFSNGYLSADDPSANKTLRAAIDFTLSRSQPYTQTANLFTAFCRTIVAGKDGTGMQSYPEEYTEVLSLLCDNTMNTPPPTFSDQIYTPRQRKGHFSAANLKVRKPSRTFQALKKAHEAAVSNRRMCWTENGRLGLIPRYAKEGDCIAVIPGSAVPYVLRKRTQENGFQLIGECYIVGIMQGEVMTDDSAPMTSIDLF